MGIVWWRASSKSCPFHTIERRTLLGACETMTTSVKHGQLLWIRWQLLKHCIQLLTELYPCNPIYIYTYIHTYINTYIRICVYMQRERERERERKRGKELSHALKFDGKQYQSASITEEPTDLSQSESKHFKSVTLKHAWTGVYCTFTEQVIYCALLVADRPKRNANKTTKPQTNRMKRIAKYKYIKYIKYSI